MNTINYKVIKRSKAHKGYCLLKNNNSGAYCIGIKDKDRPSGWMPLGYISYPENFEPACDNLAEELRCEMALG